MKTVNFMHQEIKMAQLTIPFQDANMNEFDWTVKYLWSKERIKQHYVMMFDIYGVRFNTINI